MVFSTKRGRPKKAQKEDSSKKLKKIQKFVSEPLDISLEKGIITKEQHHAGIHLRWLHTIRFGAPSITVDPSFPGGRSIENDDPKWREARENEYREALALLQQNKCCQKIIDICVYNKNPKFLEPNYLSGSVTKLRSDSSQDEYIKLTQGLDLLAKHWGMG